MTDGYAGVSNYETGQKGSCNGGGTGSNSGGCTSIGGLPPLAAGSLACGNTAGNTWNNTARDGCSDRLLD